MKTNSYIVVKIFERLGDFPGKLIDERIFDSSTSIPKLKKEIQKYPDKKFLYYQIIARTDNIIEEF